MYILTQEELNRHYSELDELRIAIAKNCEESGALRRVILNLLNINYIPDHHEWLEIMKNYGGKKK